MTTEEQKKTVEPRSCTRERFRLWSAPSFVGGNRR